MNQKKGKINYFTVLAGCLMCFCGLMLQSCFTFADYGADEYFELKHTMEYDKPDSLFLVQKSKWYLVKSKQTELSGVFDSLMIDNHTINLYRNGVSVVNENVVRDFDKSGYNLSKIYFFSENSTVNYYYMVKYLDSSNLVLAIDNYKTKWKKEAWFLFSKYKNTSVSD